MCKISNIINNDKEKFEIVVKNSNKINDVMKTYGFLDNGGTRAKIKFYISNFNIDISHFSKKRGTKYKKIEKSCLLCNKKFETFENHRDEKTCCSKKCANKFYARPFSEERKQKIANGLKKFQITSKKVRNVNETSLLTKYCPTCELPFECLVYRQKKYCSRKCLSIDPEIRLLRRNIMLEKVKNGTHSGWKSRSGKAPSYAEKFFIKVLSLNHVRYERDLNVGGFFIDFAIKDKMIALEIDGKQHMEPDRKERDERKDKTLRQNGWTVIRIPWKSINTQQGKDYMREEINSFLELYNNTFSIS